MEKNSRIYVAGNRGLVGSAIERRLRREHDAIITSDIADFDLTDARATDAFFARTQPEYVFLAAAKVGGIVSNQSYPADFAYSNLQIQNNIIHYSYLSGVKKLLFLGSSCIYPRECPQPIKEEYLLTGPLEPTNKAYAIAKIAGITMCESYNRQFGTNFISVMPTNLYGPNDNFDLESSHVLPAMIRKFQEAKVSGSTYVTLWGTGKVKREFLHVDDLADACIFLMQNKESANIINIGTGKDVSIKELADLVQKTVGFTGKIVWDKTKPDGTPQKLLNVNRIHKLGWKHKIILKDGLEATYKWYTSSKTIKK